MVRHPIHGRLTVNRFPEFASAIPNRAVATRLDGPANLSMLGIFVSGAFTPVLAKHSKNFSIVDSLAIGVDRIQRNFDPLSQ
jgi:hypothetical protein